MRIIIDILHPGHVHFFRNFIMRMEKIGHDILVTARDKEMTLELLEHYKIPYKLISKQNKGVRLGTELISRTLKLIAIAARFNPDCYMGIMGPSISIVGFLTGKPSYVFYDTEHAKITNIYVFKLSEKVITPQCYQDNVGLKQVRYNGYQELAYLHRNHFHPQPGFLNKYALEGKRLFVLRFVSWAASHDIGHLGLSYELKRKLVKLLSSEGKLIITSEAQLPSEFEKYRNRIPPNEIHDLLYYADLYIGEGATMASEAAILGTFAVYVNTLVTGTIEDQQKSGLLKHFNPKTLKENGTEVYRYVKILIESKNLKNEAVFLHRKFLQGKIDVTEWTINYMLKQYG